MNNSNPFPTVVPLKKIENYSVYIGDCDAAGELTEGENVGVAFLKNGSKSFRLKLYMWPAVQYFIVQSENEPSKYTVLSLDEYKLASGESRTRWSKIGEGIYTGSFIRMTLPLLPKVLFLCLYPNEVAESEALSA